MRNPVLTCALVIVSVTAYGFGKPQHSKVSVQSTPKDGNLEFVFKIEPNSDMSVTFDAPWTLDIKNAEGLTLSKEKLKKSDLDQKLPGFKVSTTAAPKAKSGEVEYKLVSFICTKDKTRCYREVHKGKHNWAAK